MTLGGFNDFGSGLPGILGSDPLWWACLSIRVESTNCSWYRFHLQYRRPFVKILPQRRNCELPTLFVVWCWSLRLLKKWMPLIFQSWLLNSWHPGQPAAGLSLVYWCNAGCLRWKLLQTHRHRDRLSKWKSFKCYRAWHRVTCLAEKLPWKPGFSLNR